MHKKEANYSIVVLIVMVCIGVIFFTFIGGHPTGHVVFQIGDEEGLEDKVKDFVNRMPLTRYAGDGAQVCLLIDIGNNEVYSFQIFKDSGVIDVSHSPFSRYCSNDINNIGGEDFVIKYVDYGSFIDHYNDPTCEKFIRGGGGKDFYYLPSEFIMDGGIPVCNDLFRERYCNAVAQCITNREMHIRGLDCCIERKGIYALPSFFWDVKMLIAAIGVLLLLVVLTGGLVFHKIKVAKEAEKTKKEKLIRGQKELEMYIKDTKCQGFDRETIEEHLLSIGWKKEDIDKAFEKFM